MLLCFAWHVAIRFLFRLFFCLLLSDRGPSLYIGSSEAEAAVLFCIPKFPPWKQIRASISPKIPSSEKHALTIIFPFRKILSGREIGGEVKTTFTLSPAEHFRRRRSEETTKKLSRHTLPFPPLSLRVQ